MSEAPATPPPTRYRYFTVAPRTLDLPADLLLTSVPAAARTGSTPTHSVTVTCSDIFRTNIPRVRSSRLREWLPDAIAPSAELPEWLPLPVARIALAYRPESRREALPNPDQPKQPEEKTKTPPAPVPADSKTPPAHTEPEPEPALGPRPPSSWKRILKPVLGPSVEELQERHRRLRFPAEGAETDATTEPKSQPDKPASKPSELPNPLISSNPAPQKKKSEIAPDKIALLQELFHTDDELTLQNVADRAGAIPGLQGCVLTVGDDLRLSANVPAGFDVREIRDRLLDVLESAPTETTSHGAPRTPALTLFFKDGPISILRHGSANFLVVHKERAFLPGVRKILSSALETLEGSDTPS